MRDQKPDHTGSGATGTDAVATFCGILALNYGWFAFTVARDATRSDVDPEAVLAASLSMLPPTGSP